MKQALLGVLLVLGGREAAAEMFRCQKADGSVVFQQLECPITELAPPEVPKADAPAATVVAPVPAPPPKAPTPKAFAAPERPLAVPNPVAVAPASSQDDIKPSKRKRDVLELSAQFERCRADAPGFAEKSQEVYAAWRQRHAAVISEYQKQLMAKVRAGRRGDVTLPLSLCTEEWLRGIEPLSRMPDPRYQSVEKTWQMFMGALMTGDRVTALNCLTGRAHARWKARTEAMSDDELRRIGASIRALKVQWGDDYEKEGLVADTDNRVIGIAFRNVNEEWKITEMGGAPAAGLPLQ
ncbi:hypothetical protein [Ramlibacter montanisoli]|uniref:DUF4124 domain-containing protein n=1 Tax=Ramlibacter montanisoli TaxID=2732512 RepID=A0A849KS74_9BURK|nr:hypothetical protein [Ramlibacter montanisoli]NNU44709.1 hypothetical protein [Ramlibacter montanisoli]